MHLLTLIEDKMTGHQLKQHRQSYLHDDIHDYQPSRMLQSSTAHLLQRPLILTSVASRAFTVAAPTVWNSLSVNTRSADSFASFKRRLKSELFASKYTT